VEPLSVGNLNDLIREIRGFIHSRKGPETQADATVLINVLLRAHNEGDGWIRTNELQQKLLDKKVFRSQKTLFRFLDELIKLNIIEKDERIELTPRSHSDKTKKNTYYRLKLIRGVPLEIQTHDMDRTSRLNAEFAIAKELLVELGMKDPEAIISKRFNERYSLKYTPDNSSEPRVITKETDRKKKIKL
jgi:hypothetical protein